MLAITLWHSYYPKHPQRQQVLGLIKLMLGCFFSVLLLQEAWKGKPLFGEGKRSKKAAPIGRKVSPQRHTACSMCETLKCSKGNSKISWYLFCNTAISSVCLPLSTSAAWRRALYSVISFCSAFRSGLSVSAILRNSENLSNLFHLPWPQKAETKMGLKRCISGRAKHRTRSLHQPFPILSAPSAPNTIPKWVIQIKQVWISPEGHFMSQYFFS